MGYVRFKREFMLKILLVLLLVSYASLKANISLHMYSFGVFVSVILLVVILFIHDTIKGETYMETNVFIFYIIALLFDIGFSIAFTVQLVMKYLMH